MKKLLLILTLLTAAAPGFAQLSIRPQIGYNSSSLTEDYDNLTFGNDDGFQFGVDVQMGERFYIQPGIHWESASNELRDEVNGDNNSFKVNRIRIPVMFGYKFLGPTTDGIIDVRVFTGPNASFAINKDLKETSLIAKDDFKGAIYGWNVGAGLDIAIFFVDIGYSFGLSEVFDGTASTARNNLFYANAGLRIGF